jgi:hypothetical protein
LGWILRLKDQRPYMDSPSFCKQPAECQHNTAVGGKARVNSEKSKIMPSTAAYEQIAEVR